MPESASHLKDWSVDGRVPLIWVVDDFNSALALAERNGIDLFGPRGLGRLKDLIHDTDACLSVNFVIEPEYTRAGLPGMDALETPMRDPSMRTYHDQVQAWLHELHDRAEVTVHGWSHRIAAYSPEIEINPGGWEYTRRSEWLYHPDPVGNYRRCVGALTRLGYQPVTHVFSNCGGRMDKRTLRQLRRSEFGVLAKFPTQVEACAADYPELLEMPGYLPDVDAFVFPWNASMRSTAEELEELLGMRTPIFLLNHGYEFFDPWFEQMTSYAALRRFVADHGDELVFVRYGDYANIMHERA